MCRSGLECTVCIGVIDANIPSSHGAGGAAVAAHALSPHEAQLQPWPPGPAACETQLEGPSHAALPVASPCA
jgi:hypothetical protein